MPRAALTAALLLGLTAGAGAQDPVALTPPADAGPRDWLAPPAAAGDWAETLSLFAGISGAKQPQDLGVNAHFGGRLSANYGFPVYKPANLGVQVGLAGVYQDDAVRVFEALGAKSERGQLFATAGLFQKYELWNWSVVYDGLYQDQYDTSTLTQFRGRLGAHLTDRDELGVWGTKNDRGADVEFLDIPLEIKPISQINLFWRHQFESGAYATIWGGVAEGHEELTLVLPTDNHLSTAPIFGADFRAPLNDYAALYGEANFILPADTGTVDAFLGVEFYPAAVARSFRDLAFAPILRPAGSPSFAVDAKR